MDSRVPWLVLVVCSLLLSEMLTAGCIDTWLLSSSTCPLCRRALGGGGWEREEEDAAAVLPVRLGKFRKNLSSAAPGPVSVVVSRAREAGEPSGSGLDARRCYSMGSYQYVLAEASVQVSVHRRHGGRGRSGASLTGAGIVASNPAGAAEGKRIGAGSKGDSFSVSKIWQWPRNGRGKLPVLASDDSPAMDINGGLPWQRPGPGDS